MGLFRAIARVFGIFGFVFKLGTVVLILAGSIWLALTLFSSGPGGVMEAVGLSEEDIEEEANIPSEEIPFAVNSEGEVVLSGDTVTRTTRCEDERVNEPDRDNDGLPDAWERAGETPDGVPLPNADPDHKDLYIQLNYGSNVEPLAPIERVQLRRVWAGMPVANPDGSTGIELHLDWTRQRAGNLSEPVVVTGDPDDEFERYYSEEYLGDRFCVYRQVTFGVLESDDAAGWGSTPGYAALVDGRRYDRYDGNVSHRVQVTTHELLHTGVGEMDGRPHTSEGWLTETVDDEEEFLSERAARKLNASGLYGPAQ